MPVITMGGTIAMPNMRTAIDPEFAADMHEGWADSVRPTGPDTDAEIEDSLRAGDAFMAMVRGEEAAAAALAEAEATFELADCIVCGTPLCDARTLYCQGAGVSPCCPGECESEQRVREGILAESAEEGREL